ncbi:MAG: hypothetical protein HY754_08265 [Nitrospirae bacterium]|nr:hypothetical protein [Nitrospirota bacterium]
MKNVLLKKVYFHGADDRNLEEFTNRFLSSGLLWIYIALNPKKKWEIVFKKIDKKNRPLFINEYNKAFFFTGTYRELTKLFLRREIILKNLFLPDPAEKFPQNFLRPGSSDDLRWKEALELIS